MITKRIWTLYTDVFTSDIEYLLLVIIISPVNRKFYAEINVMKNRYRVSISDYYNIFYAIDYFQFQLNFNEKTFQVSRWKDKGFTFLFNKTLWKWSNGAIVNWILPDSRVQ